jgi:alkylated DNA nucleotide flippase Atl1
VQPDELAPEMPEGTVATFARLLQEIAAVRMARVEAAKAEPAPEPRDPAWWRRLRRPRAPEPSAEDLMADQEAALVAELSQQVQMWSASQTAAETAE